MTSAPSGRRGVPIALTLASTLACAQADKAFCPDGICGWSADETDRLVALADLADTPPGDSSNRYVGNDGAIQFGRKLFWDARFSGNSSGTDALQRPMPFAR